jgi:hypothetical protein
VVDVDSTICEVHGHHKQGACYGYTHRLGYHPLLATRASSGEVLHARLRKGAANTARGILRFVDELVARLRRAGAAGELTLRMDSGFWSAKLIRRLRRHRVRYSITVRQTKTVRAAIAAIPEAAWVDIAYQPGGVAQVAETPYRGDRLIVRRVRNLGDQAQLFATWRYHAFVTNRVETTLELDADHRRHAVCELAIRDLKAGAGLAHLPSGHFNANAAWLLAATLAHNLLRWTASLGLGVSDQQTVAKTLRRTLLALPGRLTYSARQWTLHLPPAGRGPTRSPCVRGQGLMSFGVQAHVSVAGQAGSLEGTTSIRGLEPILESIAGAVDGNDIAVVQQPVKDGGGQDVVAEHAAPLAERLVRGEQDRAALVAAGHQLEDHVGVGPCQW